MQGDAVQDRISRGLGAPAWKLSVYSAASVAMIAPEAPTDSMSAGLSIIDSQAPTKPPAK